jgi:MoxR-like ATPase
MTQLTRRHDDTFLGASPRGSLNLYRAGQARAALFGREYVLPDDIKAIAPFVLSHRLIMSPSARLRNITPDEVLGAIFDELPMPEGTYAKA